MAIADEKVKQSIRRDTLIRMEVKADVTDHLTFVSGIDYKVYLPIGSYYEPVSAYQDGSSKTISWNSTTNELTISLTLPINDHYPVTVIFYLYLTTEEIKYLDKDDPTGAISNVVEWEPRLQSNVNYKDYVRDIFSSNFSFASGSSFTVINLDGHLNDFFSRFEDYISPYYFFKNEVKLWQGLNDSYQFVGYYYVESMSTSNADTIKFNIKPQAKKLMADATFNDSTAEIFATITDYPSMKPEQNGSPIPLIFSQSNSFNSTNDLLTGGLSAYFPNDPQFFYNKAICTDFSTTVASGNSNEFICCRSYFTLGAANKEIDVSNGDPSSIYTTTGTSGTFAWRTADITNASDYYSIVSNMWVETYVYNISSGTYSWSNSYITEYDHATHQITLADTSGAGNTIVKIRRVQPIAMWYKDPSDATNYMVKIPYNYITSVNQTATEGGNYLIDVVLDVSRFAIYLSSFDYYFTIFNDQYTQSPKDLSYRFLDAVGLPHNYTYSTSVTSNPCFFQIPRTNKNKYESYAQYISDIIIPIKVSMLRLDYSTGYYEFIEMPSTIDSSNYPSTYHDITDTDIIDNSMSFEKIYSDIITKYIVSNPDIHGGDLSQNSYKSYFNRRELKIYGDDKVKEFNHAGLLPEESPYDLSSVNDILRTPTIRYSLVVSLKFFDIKVLDVIKITSSNVVNNINDGTSFVFLVVTSVEKGGNAVKIEGQQVTYL